LKGKKYRGKEMKKRCPLKFNGVWAGTLNCEGKFCQWWWKCKEPEKTDKFKTTPDLAGEPELISFGKPTIKKTSGGKK